MDLSDFLGRAPTEAEGGIRRDQAARLGPGVYDNPLAAPGAALGDRPTALCVTPPFHPRDLAS